MEITPTPSPEVQITGAQTAGGASGGKTKGPSFDSILEAISGRQNAGPSRAKDGEDGGSEGTGTDGGSEANKSMEELLASTLLVLAVAPTVSPMVADSAGRPDGAADAAIEGANPVSAVGQYQGAVGPSSASVSGSAPASQPESGAQPMVASATTVGVEPQTGPESALSQPAPASRDQHSTLIPSDDGVEAAMAAASKGGASQAGDLAKVAMASTNTPESDVPATPIAEGVAQAAQARPEAAPRHDTGAAKGGAQPAGMALPQGVSAQGLSAIDGSDGAQGGGAQPNGTPQQRQGETVGTVANVSTAASAQASQLFGSAVVTDGAAAALPAERPAASSGNATPAPAIGAVTPQTGDSGQVVTASASPAAAADQQTANSVFNQVLEQAAKLSVPRNTRMRVQLSPPNLGGVELRLSLKDGVLSLGIGAELGKTREMIQAALPELRQALEQKGLEVGHLSLSTGNGQGGFGGWLGSSTGSFGPGNQWVGAGRQPSGEAQFGASAEADTAEPSGRRAGNGSGDSQHLVDYRI